MNGAKHVIVVMQHAAKGNSTIVSRCILPRLHPGVFQKCLRSGVPNADEIARGYFD
jgi:acyl CoA:acetate/3-ketoacid CoA transferase beta subunit